MSAPCTCRACTAACISVAGHQRAPAVHHPPHRLRARQAQVERLLAAPPPRGPLHQPGKPRLPLRLHPQRHLAGRQPLGDGAHLHRRGHLRHPRLGGPLRRRRRRGLRRRTAGRAACSPRPCAAFPPARPAARCSSSTSRSTASNSRRGTKSSRSRTSPTVSCARFSASPRNCLARSGLRSPREPASWIVSSMASLKAVSTPIPERSPSPMDGSLRPPPCPSSLIESVSVSRHPPGSLRGPDEHLPGRVVAPRRRRSGCRRGGCRRPARAAARRCARSRARSARR